MSKSIAIQYTPSEYKAVFCKTQIFKDLIGASNFLDKWVKKINVFQNPYTSHSECIYVNDEIRHGDTFKESVQVDYWPTGSIDRSYNVEVDVCSVCYEQVDLND